MNGLVFGSIKSDYLQSDQRKLSRYSNLLELGAKTIVAVASMYISTLKYVCTHLKLHIFNLI